MYGNKRVFSSLKYLYTKNKGFKSPFAKFGLLAGGAGTTYIVSSCMINADDGEKKETKGLTYNEKVMIFTLCASTFVGFNIVALPFFVSGLSKFGKIPFLTTPKHQLSAIFEMIPEQKLLKIGDKPTFVDLGSGDGRVVIEAAKKGYNAVGYEINPWLVMYSRSLAKKQGVADSCKFVLGDFWQADLSSTSVVAVYGLDTIMDRLKSKIDSEMPVGSFIVSNSFRIPRWKPLDMKQEVYLYVKKDRSMNETTTSETTETKTNNQ